MKHFCLTIILLFCCALSAFANDGAFYVSGNTLVPLQETQISLKKEVLKFYIRDFEWMDVTVDFEFHNPGAAKTITVGFVTPPASGDVSEEDQSHPQIKDFTVNVNSKKLNYEMKRMENTSFASANPNIIGEDFVYYFKVRFNRGVNKIRHTYRFRGSSGIEMRRGFDYQITTGKRWANKKIDDFELQVHLDNGIFAIPATFRSDGKFADWQIVGDGVIAKEPRVLFGGETQQSRMVHLNSGYLKLNEKNFKPDLDIMIGEYNWPAMWTNIWCHPKAECKDKKILERVAPYMSLKPAVGNDDYDFVDLSDDELKLIRNYAYAVRGLAFKDELVKNFYSNFFWYKPNTSIKVENIKLTAKEDAFLKMIRRIEAKQNKN